MYLLSYFSLSTKTYPTIFIRQTDYNLLYFLLKSIAKLD